MVESEKELKSPLMKVKEDSEKAVCFMFMFYVLCFMFMFMFYVLCLCFMFYVYVYVLCFMFMFYVYV